MNPTGKNSAVHWQGLTQDPPVYGDKQRQAALQRLAVPAGQSQAAAPLNAPQRLQRRASRPQPVQLPPPETLEPVGQPTLEGLPYPQQLAALWQAVASQPGASPLVQTLAQQAQKGTS